MDPRHYGDELMNPPDTEYFWFEMKYKKSTYKSTDYNGYFSTWAEADKECSRIYAFHKKKIEDLGDIFEKPKITIYRVSAALNEFDPAPNWIKWGDV